MIPSEEELIRREIANLKMLAQKGRALEERGLGSKLDKLRELLHDQHIFGDSKAKLLIFTVFKEILDFLVDQFRSWGLRVTEIHSGMKVSDRYTPVTRLYAEREICEEAQAMETAEAAGEGINLKFCWLMVNYDIPWNPMRLEQHIRRIHRYGQTRDCLIFNFVAANIREGKVLQRLLERLKEIRKELGSDQVFDMVGEVILAQYLKRLFRGLCADRLTQQAVLERVVSDLDLERFDRICRSTLECFAKWELNLSPSWSGRPKPKSDALCPKWLKSSSSKPRPA
ncbi:SWF/SNF helicase family protein [Candidatus Methylacidiphilum infernorum]|uniref:SWF/SNF helicase family protein n=1 Tax=Candidatus Methylacidiphilum infernorum TaxID=511746 RepID=A0ABX7PSY6_9BACT|nr:C-terminal helicase domain-containing protein [Candidatus Methylacidiphilum infernorum]QSR86089.1 SWF/SNF helicase family protein [Candidatus Methylacidiphilum infernorum]